MLLVLLTSVFCACFFFAWRHGDPLNMDVEYGIEIVLRFKDFMFLYSADPSIFSISKDHILCALDKCWMSDSGKCDRNSSFCEQCKERYIAIDLSRIDRMRFRNWVARGIEAERMEREDCALHSIIEYVEVAINEKIKVFENDSDQNDVG